MRTALGLGVFAVGLGALGWWSYDNHASTIEETLTATSATALEGLSRHGVSTDVSGRDITVSGLAHDDAEAAKIVSTLDGLTGTRVVRDKMERLPSVAPYHLSADKTLDGLMIVGVMPDQARIDAIKDAQDENTKVTLDLAAGEPDALWGQAVETGLAGLSQLQTGSLKIEDRTLSVSGLAASRNALAATQDAFATLPKGYSVVADLDLPPHPALDVSFDGTQADVRGNLPKDTSADSFAALGAEKVAIEATLDRDSADRARWDQTLAAGLAGLAKLSPGRLQIDEKKVVLKGRAPNMAAADAAAEALAGVPNGYAVETAIDLAPTPGLVVAYDATAGAVLTGALPQGSDLDALKASVPAATVETKVTLDAEGDASAVLEATKAFGKWIGEYESAKLVAEAGKVSLDAETAPGANTALIAKRLKEALGGSAVIATRVSAKTVADGTKRLNQATGQQEVYQAGYWLPALSFDPSAETCSDQAKGVLAAKGISFLSGSSDLDVTARAALNKLAAVVRMCTQGGALALEIGGHTDNTGSLAVNERLSNERAAIVAEALVERGVKKAVVSSKGYGPSQPIADNATAEGRAQNRRTEVTWIER